MHSNKTALITGASKGFGFQVAKNLAQKGWNLVLTARNASELHQAQKQIHSSSTVIAKSGDVRDEVHLLELAETLQQHQLTLDLVINNASALGPSPLPELMKHPVENMHTVWHTNVIAPLSLLQQVEPYLATHPVIVNLSSDAAIEAYETWGVYGASKAGLDHLTAVLGKENPDWRCYAFDPGDMRTDMHQAAFPGEDISDRPLPEEKAVPAFLDLLQSDLPSGRYSVSSPQTISL